MKFILNKNWLWTKFRGTKKYWNSFFNLSRNTQGVLPTLKPPISIFSSFSLSFSLSLSLSLSLSRSLSVCFSLSLSLSLSLSDVFDCKKYFEVYTDDTFTQSTKRCLKWQLMSIFEQGVIWNNFDDRKKPKTCLQIERFLCSSNLEIKWSLWY